MNCTQGDGSVMQWMVTGRDTFRVCGTTMPRLPAGAYQCTIDYCGNQFFQGKQLQVDELIDFSESLSSKVLREIDQFWHLGERFRQFGFLHRRGYLFYGKQGSGKSSLIHQIVSKIVEGGHIAFFCSNPTAFIPCLESFRAVEPDRPIVCVFEDIDAMIKDYGDTDLLQWLDGNHQVNKAVNLASTNYPEKLDPRIVSRPRRFDRVLRIDAPDARFRNAYFARKMPQQSTADRERWVSLTEGLPFAALTELIISVQCLGNDLEKTVALLRNLDEHNPTSQEYEAEESENGETNGQLGMLLTADGE